MAEENKKVILVVEDEISLSQILSSRLKRAGFDVIQAYNGEEALKILRQKKPGLILLDLILPGKFDGFEVLETMQSDPTLQSSPVVIVSNLGQESDIQRGEQLGVVGYFVKAKTSIDDLVAKIKSILDARQGV